MELTPKEQGYYMPAEWENHSATWLAWPYDDTTFPGLIPEIEKTYCDIVKALEENEIINILVLNEIEKIRIQDILNNNNVNLSQVIFFIKDYADVWTRDYTPITLRSTERVDLAYVNWDYNAYGKKDDPYFSDLMKDDKVFDSILNDSKNKIFRTGIVLEGGAIEVNGEGTLLTTEQCLLNTNRNGNVEKPQIEKYLKDYFGVVNIIWLKEGLTNDHTDGHIDEIARFVSQNTIVCAYEDDINDPNYSILDDNYKVLENATDKDGNKFKVIKLPMPHMNYDNGEKAPVSYTNFYIGNTIILMPIFNDPNDEKAIEIIQSLFPNRKIIKIDCTKLIYGGGGLHCITMQQSEV